jgi:hypothetical protein
MKKIIVTTITAVLFLTVAYGQTMNEKEAKQYLEKAWSYVKASDSISFINLWQLSEVESKSSYSKSQAIAHFNFIKEYLDTALTRNLKIDQVDVVEENLKGTDSKYWIKAWFKYDEHYYKGFGFYLANVNGKWIARGNPSTSTREKHSAAQK